MPRVVLTVAEWRAVAHELAGLHTAAAPPGLLERVLALLAQAPLEWPDQPFALELDASGAEAVHAVHAACTGTGMERRAGQREASLSEAIQIIHDHQQRD